MIRNLYNTKIQRWIWMAQLGPFKNRWSLTPRLVDLFFPLNPPFISSFFYSSFVGASSSSHFARLPISSALLIGYRNAVNILFTTRVICGFPTAGARFTSVLLSEPPNSEVSLKIFQYWPEISFPPTTMTTPVLSPTATIADPTTLQGEVDKEKLEYQSNNADFKILLSKDFGFIPVPRHLRYDPTKPFHFGLLLNIGFGLASTFSECFNLIPFLWASQVDWLNFDYSCRESLLLSAVAQ